MKGIIYTDKQMAETDLAICSANIDQGEALYSGEGPFVNPQTGRPYSYVFKHPTEEKWALVADEKVEAALDREMEELDATWLPQGNLLGIPMPNPIP